MPPSTSPQQTCAPGCMEHSGIAAEVVALGRSLDSDRNRHHEDMAAIRAQLDTTNVWLQKITEEALRRWPAHAVRMFSIASGVCGALFAALITLLAVHFSK